VASGSAGRLSPDPGRRGGRHHRALHGRHPFTLAALDDKQGAATLGFALKAGTPMSYLALEGGVEAAKKQKRYNLRLAGRAMF
jgi:hypothetical protein